MIRPKILIAGAGIGGLATACCLLKRGFDVEVYEQAPALSEVGAGIQISANAMHVLRYLGLGDAILRVGVQPKAYVFRLHDTGEVIQTFALSEEHRRQHGAPYIQLHRADLHDLLVVTARKLKPGVVHLNRKVVGFVERDGAVELNFAQGAPARGDMLIGADGLKSVVRAQVFGTVPPTYTGDGVWRVTVSTERPATSAMTSSPSRTVRPATTFIPPRKSHRAFSLNTIQLVGQTTRNSSPSTATIKDMSLGP